MKLLSIWVFCLVAYFLFVYFNFGDFRWAVVYIINAIFIAIAIYLQFIKG